MFRNPLTDSIVALVILLLIFGPKRLPALGRSLGQGIRDFRQSLGGGSSGADDQSPALIPAQTSASAATPTVSPAQAPSDQ